jgi:hypothetical protein
VHRALGAEPHIKVRGEIAWDAALPEEGLIGFEGESKAEWLVALGPAADL